MNTYFIAKSLLLCFIEGWKATQEGNPGEFTVKVHKKLNWDILLLVSILRVLFTWDSCSEMRVALLGFASLGTVIHLPSSE